MLLNPPEAVPPDRRSHTRRHRFASGPCFFHELMPFFKTFWTLLGFEAVISEKIQ